MIINPIEISESISILCAELKHEEFALDFWESQSEFEQSISLSAKGKLGENMSARLNSLTPACFFGVTLREVDGGRILACIASRKDTLGGMSIGEYLQLYFGRILTGKDGDIKLSERLPAFARRQVRDAAYVGELWVHPDNRDLRTAKLLVKLAILLGLQLWNVEYTYAFLVARHMKVGPLQYGWTRAYAKALQWDVGPVEIPEDVGFVGIVRDEVGDLARQVIEEWQMNKKKAS